MAWLVDPIPSFKKAKITKTKAKESFPSPQDPRPKTQDPIHISPPRHDAPFPSFSAKKVMVQLFPIPSQEEKGDPSWLCTSSQSHKSRRERELFSFQGPPQKEPLWNSRKKEKICWKCSQTFSFNDKVVLFAKVGVLLFQFHGESQDSLPENLPKELENTSC